MLDLEMFLSLDDSLSQSQEAVTSINMEFNQPVVPPVVSGKHCWCSLKCIKYHVWVKKRLDEGHINVNDV